MKKNYFMLVCLVLFMATNATAQVNSVADLFGKYKFTADVEFTAEGQSYKDVLSGDCDATIEEDAIYSAKIVGFAGSKRQQNINAISTEKKMLKVLNLNNPALWSNGLLLANENGDNPYGLWDSEAGEWAVESYGPVYYTYDPDTKEISIPNFTVVTLENAKVDAKGTIIAKYTNVKMTLVDAEDINVADISGDWNFTAGSGTYDTMEGSAFPTEFTVALAKNGNDNRNYTATMAIEGYNAVEMPATFDGSALTLTYDNLFINEAEGIRFAPMYGSATAGTIEFKSQSETTFTLYNGFSFASDKVVKAADEKTDSLVVNGEYHQWYIAGTLKSANGSSQASSWDGVYNVSLKNPAQDLYIADAAGFDWPTEFEFEVTHYKEAGIYMVTKIFGMDVTALNYGGLLFTPAEDGKSASISTGNLMTIEQGVSYLVLRDINMVEGTIDLHVNEDGTMTSAGFSVATINYNTNDTNLNAFYANLIVEKAEQTPVVPDTPAFSWEGKYALTSTVESYDGNTYPSSFYFNVKYYEETEYAPAQYLVTTFIGNDISALNYGGILLKIAEDGKSATMSNGIVGTVEAGVTYLKLRDMNAQEAPVELTLNEDGTVSMADFTVVAGEYSSSTNDKLVAWYKNVVLVKGGEIDETGIENVTENNTAKGIFDIQGRKIEKIVAPGLYIINGKKSVVK